jgi:hypothetical protein
MKGELMHKHLTDDELAEHLLRLMRGPEKEPDVHGEVTVQLLQCPVCMQRLYEIARKSFWLAVIANGKLPSEIEVPEKAAH